MNGVIGMASLLLDMELDEDQLDCVQTIQKSSEHLLALMNDILDYSKIEAGQFKIAPLSFSLPLLLQNTVNSIMPLVTNKSLAFKHKTDEDVPGIIFGDENSASGKYC